MSESTYVSDLLRGIGLRVALDELGSLARESRAADMFFHMMTNQYD